MKRTAASLLFAAVVALASACNNGAEEPQATSTPKPIPSPVAFAPEPEGNFTLGDPSFEALPGAQAHFGRLGGSIYRIEVPDDWNGRLVLYMHSYHAGPTLAVDSPGIRGYLIRNGFAWGASSYSANRSIPGLAADETAALWDHFVQQFGQPERTYVTGLSMGGAGAAISAERYRDRYDGALGLCGTAGNTPQLAFSGDYLVAGAFAAGITQVEFDSMPVRDLIETRILPALQDPSLHERFEAIVIDLTGGPRPFDHEGFLLRETVNWDGLPTGQLENQDTVYELGPLSSVSSDEFNAAAVRVAGGPLRERYVAGHDITGDVQMPLLTLHTTGDLGVPISQQQELRRKVEAAGKGDLLVQRAIRAPGHCAFSHAEWESGLEDLVDWVEDGVRPEGEDLLVADLSEVGGQFTLAPRLGAPEAEAVPGADERLTISGTLTLDDEPLVGRLETVVVRKDGLKRCCGLFGFIPVADGSYEVKVAGDGEARGCGGPGAEVVLTVFSQGERFVSQRAMEWPAVGLELTFDAAFSTAAPEGVGSPVTAIHGSVLDSSGKSLPPGTVIEAYIGDTLCGVASLPRVLMACSDPTRYHLVVVGPESVPGCGEGATVSFRVDGEPVDETTVNDFPEDGRELDLTLP